MFRERLSCAWTAVATALRSRSQFLPELLLVRSSLASLSDSVPGDADNAQLRSRSAVSADTQVPRWLRKPFDGSADRRA